MVCRIAALALALFAMGCSPQKVSDPVAAEEVKAAAHPISGLDVVPLTVTSGDAVHKFDVEVARTPQQQAMGLMFRTELGPEEGMIFPRRNLGVASFWMKNTPLPLDIIFVGADGKIMNIAANTVPYSLESVTAIGPTSLVLEIPGGRAAELGIGAGDAVEWQDRSKGE